MSQNPAAVVHDLLMERLKRSVEGYARLTVDGVFHYFRPSGRDHFLEADCDRGVIHPMHGAKLKKREDLPDSARICKPCEARRQTRGYFETIHPKER